MGGIREVKTAFYNYTFIAFFTTKFAQLILTRILTIIIIIIMMIIMLTLIII